MPLSPGSVTVNADGTHSGSGAALSIFESAYADHVADHGVPTSPELMAGVKRGLAQAGKMFGYYTTYLMTEARTSSDNEQLV